MSEARESVGTTEPIYLNAGKSGYGWSSLEMVGICDVAWGLRMGVGDGATDAATLPTRSGALVLGSIVHVGLAHYYARVGAAQGGIDLDVEDDGAGGSITRNVTDAKAIMAPFAAMRRCALDADRALWDAGIGPTWTCYLSHAQEIVKAYATHWSKKDRFRVRAVERVVELPLKGVGLSGREIAFTFTARVDLTVEESGLIYIWDHKCLPHDALVWTDSGLTPAGALPPHFRVAAWDGKRTVWADAAAVPAAPQEIVELDFSHGERHRFGAEHPIWTPSGWKRAVDLQEGDEAGVALGQPDMAEARISDEMLVVIGMLVCDGAMKRNSMPVTKTEREIREYYRHCARRLGCKPRVVFCKNRAPYVELGAPAAVYEALAKYGIARVSSTERNLPDAFLAALSQRQLGILLGAMWLCDGSTYIVHDGARGKMRHRARITFAGRSEGVVRAVQRILLRLGLTATFVTSSVSYKGERRPYYYATVVGNKARRQFLRLIAFDVIPMPGLNSGVTRAKRRLPTIAEMREAMESLRSRGCQQKVDGNIWWVSVHARRTAAAEPLVSVTVPRLHTLIVGSVLTHNTAGKVDDSKRSGYTLSGQIIGLQTIGARLYGSRFGGVVLNMVGTSDRPAFTRFPPYPAPEALRKCAQVLIDREDHVRMLRASGRSVADFPAAWSEARVCMGRYGACEYQDQCRFGRG